MKVVDDPEIDILIREALGEICEATNALAEVIRLQCERVLAGVKSRGADPELEACIGAIANFTDLPGNGWEEIAHHFGVSESHVGHCEAKFRVRFMRAVPYRTYLTLEHWQRQRKKALDRSGHKCSLCSGTNRLDVHHRTYERLGEEAPEDLTVLCRRCHENFHKTGRLARPKD